MKSVAQQANHALLGSIINWLSPVVDQTTLPGKRARAHLSDYEGIIVLFNPQGGCRAGEGPRSQLDVGPRRRAASPESRLHIQQGSLIPSPGGRRYSSRAAAIAAEAEFSLNFLADRSSLIYNHHYSSARRILYRRSKWLARIGAVAVCRQSQCRYIGGIYSKAADQDRSQTRFSFAAGPECPP